MITTTYAKFSHYNAEGVTVQIVTMMGLSTDSKPTDASIGNGSAFLEMNTSKLYFYDAASESWKEWGADASSEQPNLSMAASPAVIRPNLGLNVSEPDVVEPDVVEDGEQEVEEPEEPEQEEQSEEEAR